MSVLHWVRHGPTHAKTMIGWTDRAADLSDHARISRLNDHLPDHALLVSSDLRRAAATADALAHPGRRRLPDDPALREIHFGAWEDRSFDAVSAAEPDAIAAFWQAPGATGPPAAKPGTISRIGFRRRQTGWQNAAARSSWSRISAPS